MRVRDYRTAKQRVIQLVSEVKATLPLPFQYDGIRNPVAEKLGIQVKEEELSLDEGQYVPSSPPQIIIDPRIQDLDRRNFTFFHEVTHYLIDQDDELIEFLHEYAYYKYESTLEGLCNVGAAEFLVPVGEVQALIQAQGFQISLIELLDQRFPASKPALALQLAEAARHRCVVVVCEYGFPPRQARGQAEFLSTEPKQGCLFVQYAATSPSCQYPCGRFARIPANHLIWSAYQDRCSLKGRATIPFPSGKVWSTDCEAYFYFGKVYAAFHITAPPAKEQLCFEFF